MRRLVLLTVLALGTTVVEADNALFYLGAGVTHSSLTESYDYIAYYPTDLNNNSWTAFAGVRPLNWLAAEVDYIDLGSGNSITNGGDTFNQHTHADSSAWAAYAIGFLPLPLPVVDVYGKLGLARWQLKANLIQDFYNPPSTLVTPKSYSGTDFAWGIGVQSHYKMFGLRLEYEGFEVKSNTASVVALSVFLNF